MANTSSSILLLALVLVATASVAHCSLSIGGKVVDIITVNGTVNCTSTGKGAPGVNVSLSLDLGNTTVAAAVTHKNGTFTLTVDVDIAVVDSVGVGVGISLSDIIVIAKVPAGTCNATSPAKVVKSPVALVDIMVTAGGLLDAILGVMINI